MAFATFGVPASLLGFRMYHVAGVGPLLRFRREYKEALQELGYEDWPELKAKLSTNDAEEVMVYLRAYLAAHRLEVEAKNNYMEGRVNGGNVLWMRAFRNKVRVRKELTAQL